MSTIERFSSDETVLLHSRGSTSLPVDNAIPCGYLLLSPENIQSMKVPSKPEQTQLLYSDIL